MNRQENIRCSDDQALSLRSNKANAGGDGGRQLDSWRGECKAINFNASGEEYQLFGLGAAMMILLLIGIDQFQSDTDTGRFTAGIFDLESPVRSLQAVSATRG